MDKRTRPEQADRTPHWETILDIVERLRAKYPRRRAKSEVRIDCPGHLGGFCSDVALTRPTACGYLASTTKPRSRDEVAGGPGI